MAKSEPTAAWGLPGAAGRHGAAPLVHGHGGAGAPRVCGMTEPRGDGQVGLRSCLWRSRCWASWTRRMRRMRRNPPRSGLGDWWPCSVQ